MPAGICVCLGSRISRREWETETVYIGDNCRKKMRNSEILAVLPAAFQEKEA
jgi:hypothetical protein